MIYYTTGKGTYKSGEVGAIVETDERTGSLLVSKGFLSIDNPKNKIVNPVEVVVPEVNLSAVLDQGIMQVVEADVNVDHSGCIAVKKPQKEPAKPQEDGKAKEPIKRKVKKPIKRKKEVIKQKPEVSKKNSVIF
jgi:hypothetical protein